MIYGVIYFSVIFFTTLFHIPTAEAFDRKAQEVSSLQYFSKLATQVLDFNDLASTVTDIALKAANGDSAWIALKGKEEDNLKIIANKNIGLIDTLSLSKYIIERAENAKPGMTAAINLQKYWKNVPPVKDQRQPESNYSYALCSSLKAYNESIGNLIIVKKSNLIFDQEDIAALNTFSDYASIAIENSKLLKESIEKERLEKELDVAREIQRKILPEKNPVHDKLSIASVFIPAFEVGGDYYDFFEIDKNRMGFIIADVSGKGISAAFIMAELKGIFESLSGSCTRNTGTQSITSPKEILIQANEILQRTLERKNFVSAVYGIIDFQKEELHIARAGHCPILLIREHLIQNLRPTGIGLGLDFSERFKESLEEIRINLKENDTIVLYTDGITEAKNLQMQDFGDQYFEKILMESWDKEADEISGRVIKEVTLFSQNISQHDDITLVILKWKDKKNDGVKEWQNSMHQLKTRAI
jgi:serine phosphatase RsbU (regulator of sigma subunit)